MKNREVIENFFNGRNSHTRNLSSEDGKLMNYSTCIAQMWDGAVIVNRTRYSVTTSKLQNWVAFEASHRGVNQIELRSVPINTGRLSPNMH